MTKTAAGTEQATEDNQEAKLGISRSGRRIKALARIVGTLEEFSPKDQEWIVTRLGWVVKEILGEVTSLGEVVKEP